MVPKTLTKGTKPLCATGGKGINDVQFSLHISVEIIFQF